MVKINTLLRLRKAAKALSWGGRILIAQRLLRRAFVGATGLVHIDDFDGSLSIELRLSEHMQSRIFWLDYYNIDIVSVLNSTIRPGMVIIDVGANIGELTMVCANRTGPTGKVIAFEPVECIAAALEANISKNKLSWVQIVRAGVSDFCGWSNIYESFQQSYLADENYGLASLYGKDNDCSVLQTVELVTLDSFLDAHPQDRVDLIKIDIEGAELPCLLGSERTLRRYRPTLIIEVQADSSGAAGYKQSDILDYLCRFNYSIYKIGRRGRLRPMVREILSDFQNVLCVPNHNDTIQGLKKG